jgi:hypothetical protein
MGYRIPSAFAVNKQPGGHRRGLHLAGLQRWNSSSPAQGRWTGRGYLLYHTDKYGTVDLGIAIDPGFDFVRNLFHGEFSISNIDIVLIGHSHVHHVRDFEAIVQMLTDLKKLGNKREKCVHVMLSLGVHERLKHIIEDPFYRYHVEAYIVDVLREIERGYFENLSRSRTIHFPEREDTHKNKYSRPHPLSTFSSPNLCKNSGQDTDSDHSYQDDGQPLKTRPNLAITGTYPCLVSLLFSQPTTESTR